MTQLRVAMKISVNPGTGEKWLSLDAELSQKGSLKDFDAIAEQLREAVGIKLAEWVGNEEDASQTQRDAQPLPTAIYHPPSAQRAEQAPPSQHDSADDYGRFPSQILISEPVEWVEVNEKGQLTFYAAFNESASRYPAKLQTIQGGKGGGIPKVNWDRHAQTLEDFMPLDLQPGEKRRLSAPARLTFVVSDEGMKNTQSGKFSYWRNLTKAESASAPHQYEDEDEAAWYEGQRRHKTALTKQGDLFPDGHWMADESNRNNFWGAVKRMGFSHNRTHQLLGVASMYDYTGTQGDALTALQAAANTQA